MPDSGSIDVEVRDTMFAWSRGQQPSVLFDFNGTLSNDEPDLLCETFGAVFRECLGWHMTESVYLEEFVGLSDTEIITTAVQQHGDGTAEQISQLKQRHTAMYNERAEQEVLIGTETVRLVEMLAGQDIPMGIVTGANANK